MPKIKTRETHRDIKVLDKASVAGERMKNAFIRSKDTAKNLADDGQITPEEYAEDSVSMLRKTSPMMLATLPQTRERNWWSGGEMLFASIVNVRGNRSRPIRVKLRGFRYRKRLDRTQSIMQKRERGSHSNVSLLTSSQ